MSTAPSNVPSEILAEATLIGGIDGDPSIRGFGFELLIPVILSILGNLFVNWCKDRGPKEIKALARVHDSSIPGPRRRRARQAIHKAAVLAVEEQIGERTNENAERFDTLVKEAIRRTVERGKAADEEDIKKVMRSARQWDFNTSPVARTAEPPDVANLD